MTISHRPAEANDYDWIIEAVDDWWGRPISSALPRLFLEHFFSTSLVAEVQNIPVGFLVGFHSPSIPSESYIHFVGVHPDFRRQSVAKGLYEHFFDIVREVGRSEVRAVTASINEGSIRFHRRLGFDVSAPKDRYNGPGTELVEFSRVV